ncbi:CDP-glycerol glycerophosphotransferase family protein [Clostridium bornimense]|nr:CDP-glycerol glycerophosphotransferase family protein [Clostridium bornimense]
MRIFPINKFKIVASNFNGKGYGDNPKYLVEALKDEQFKIVWLVKYEDYNMPDYIVQVKYSSLKALYHLATAKLWIDNSRKESYVIKRKNQYYIQMWHGSIALKRIENDVEDILNEDYVKRAKHDSNMIDLMISNSNFSDKLFSESFWYKGEILKSGTPRIDALFDSNKEEFKKRFINDKKISEECGFILYAPTFRDNANLDVYDFNRQEVLKVFEQKFGKKFYLLLRLHPNLRDVIKFKSDEVENIIDVSEYSDIYELMKISDFLITDYSSLMFEFSIAERKGVFLFAKDVEEYNRGFYFDIKGLPFELSTNSDELIEIISKFDTYNYKVRVNEFYKRLDIFENGNASYYISDYIKNRIF